MRDTSHWEAEYTVSNMEAARRQLKTAIRMWFYDDDLVSTHTLAHASHEIIHVLTKKTRTGHLMYDNTNLKPEPRKKFNNWLAKPGNFYKHGGWQKKEGETITVKSALTEMYILFSLLGLQQDKKILVPEEYVYLFYFIYHTPQFLTEEGRKMFIESMPVKDLESIRWLPKREFFNAFVSAENKAVLAVANA